MSCLLERGRGGVSGAEETLMLQSSHCGLMIFMFMPPEVGTIASDKLCSRN